MIDPEKYRLLFYSERLLPRVGGVFTGCRIATTGNGYAMATAGESTLTPWGRLKGKAARRADLVRGWKGTGDTARDGYNQSHVAGITSTMFPGLPQPDLMNTSDWSRVLDKLDDGFAISIAVRLAALPLKAALDDYTRADHQILVYGRLPDDRTWAVDPMHAHSNSYRGDKVPLAEVRKAAKAINDGLILCELYPIGGWTQKALLRTRKNAQIASLEADAAKTERRLRKRIAELEATVPPDCQQLVANARAAAHEHAHVTSIEWHQEQRVEGP